MGKKRILIVSDPLSQVTGLAYVAGSFARYFIQKEDYEVGYFTLRGKFENKIQAVNDDILDDLKIYSSQSGESILKNFIQTIEDFNPHIVITVADPWDCEIVAFNTYRYSYCWFAYTTIEVPKFYSDRIYMNSGISQLNFRSFFEILFKSDLVIPVTDMARKTLEDLRVSDRKLNNVSKTKVFNGVDTELRIKEKKSKFEVFNGFLQDDNFVVMSLGVNSERKKMDQVIIAFAGLIKKLKAENDKNVDKIRLYLHTNTHSAPSGTDLRAVINEYGIKDYVLSMSSNSMVGKEKVYELYSVCDMYVGLPGGEGFGLGFCFPEGTSIVMEKNIKNIEDINIDDRVITHLGNIKSVTKKTKRLYSGYLFSIKTRNNLPLSLTEGHSIFSVKTNKRFTYLEEKNLIPDWNKVESLKKNDLIAIPKIKQVDKVDSILISDYVKELKLENEEVYFNMSRKTNGKYSLKTIAKKFGCTFQTVHKALNYQRNSKLMKDIRNYCDEIGYVVPDSIKCKNKIELTPDVMEFFGLYIAEGSSSGDSIEFSFHRDEVDFQNLVVLVGKKIFGNVSVLIKHKENTKSCSVIISSKVASKLMASLFGKGAINKHIPYIFYGSSNIGSLLKGYFNGDGCLIGKITAKTISKGLAFDIFKILNINNIYLSIHKLSFHKIQSYSKKIKNRNNIIVGKHDQYIIGIYEQHLDRFLNLIDLEVKNKEKNKTKRKQNYIKENKNYFFVPILDLNKKYVNIPVYNFHVEEDESYLAEGYTVHNCEAMLHKKPVVYIDRGGHTEFANQGGLSVKVKDYQYAMKLGLKWALPDIDDAVNQMYKLYKSSSLRRELGQKGHDYVIENLDWSNVGKQLEDVILDFYNKTKEERMYGIKFKRLG